MAAALDRICSRCHRIEPCGCPPDPRRIARNRARSKAKGYKTSHWQRVRRQVLARDHVCRRCGSSSDLTVHVVDGRDHRKAQASHCVTLCRRCHGREDG